MGVVNCILHIMEKWLLSLFEDEKNNLKITQVCAKIWRFA